MSARRTAAAVGVAVAALLPLAAFAQSDLQTTIRAELLKDPRTGVMTQTQIDAMIAALSQNAQQKGLTPQDITWRPTGDQPITSSNFCAPYPRYLCVMSEAFGFIGSDYILPIWLAILSLLFLLVNALHKHHERVNAMVQTTTVPPAQMPPSMGQNLQ